MAAGLGLGGDRLELPIGVLSGGERRRVELARILFAGSDVLLLDEPTNHLDIDAKMWLLQFLRTYRGALLVISHDIDLLDEAITRVLHLDRPAEDASGELVEYKGTLQPVPRGAREGRGAHRQEGRVAGQGDRPAADGCRPVRREGHQGVRWRTARRSRSCASRRSASTSPRATALCA